MDREKKEELIRKLDDRSLSWINDALNYLAYEKDRVDLLEKFDQMGIRGIDIWIYWKYVCRRNIGDLVKFIQYADEDLLPAIEAGRRTLERSRMILPL